MDAYYSSCSNLQSQCLAGPRSCHRDSHGVFSSGEAAICIEGLRPAPSLTLMSGHMGWWIAGKTRTKPEMATATWDRRLIIVLTQSMAILQQVKLQIYTTWPCLHRFHFKTRIHILLKTILFKRVYRPWKQWRSYSSVIIIELSVIPSVIWRMSYVVCHPSYSVCCLSSVICRLTSVICRRSSSAPDRCHSIYYLFYRCIFVNSNISAHL